MYNSSIKGQSTGMTFQKHIEIPNKAFFNDLSKNYMHDSFKSCDVIFSEPAWSYGYKVFNRNAGNEPDGWAQYMENIQRLIDALNVPAFIVCGKPSIKYFHDFKTFPISITTSGTNMTGCTLYVWNYDMTGVKISNTVELTNLLSKRFHKCLDFSCGYGEHLLKFDDFVGCDINRDCITYLSIISEERKCLKK